MNLALQRYLLREVLAAAVLSLAVLLAVMLALTLAELLGEVARGRVASGSVALLLALRLPETAILVGPLALLTGLLLAVGRMAEHSELTIMRLSGLTFRRVQSAVVVLSGLWALALLVATGWVAPWAIERSSQLIAEAARQALTASVQPGQFEQFDDGRLTIYVGAIEREPADRSQDRINEVIVHIQDEEDFELLTARHGRIWEDPGDGQTYLSLFDGYQLRHAAALAEHGRSELLFARNDIRLPLPEPGAVSEPEKLLSLTALWPVDSPARLREMHWRLAAPLASLVLGMMALSLAPGQARVGRFGPLVIALVVYLVYTNAIHVGLVLMADQRWSAATGLWPVHGLFAGFGAWLLIRRWRSW